jgi:hypothetical protein
VKLSPDKILDAPSREVICDEIAECARKLEISSGHIRRLYSVESDSGNPLSQVTMLREAMRRMVFALSALEAHDKANPL